MGSGAFQVELEELEKVATEKFPMAIDDLTVAAGHVTSTLPLVIPAFAPGPGGVKLLEGVSGAWGDAFQRILSDVVANRENLDLARQAVLEIVERYRRADGQG